MEQSPKEGLESITVPNYKKGDRSSCEIWRGISLVMISSKLPVDFIVRRLSGICGRCTRESQANFRPNQSFVDQVFNLRQILEHRHVFHRSTISILDLKTTFDSVSRAILWRSFLLSGMPAKSVLFSQTVYLNSRS